MDKLLIVARDGKFIVKCNGRIFERQTITDVLENTFLDQSNDATDATEMVATIFAATSAEALVVFGEGEVWLAQAIARGKKMSGTGDSAYSALASLFASVLYSASRY